MEYICDSCHLSWNFRAPQISDVHNFQSCKRCGAQTPRQGLPSSLSIQRSGTSSATLDHVVGKDSEARWDQFNERKEERDTLRRDIGTPALTQKVDGGYEAATPEKIALRKKAYEALKQ